MTDERDFDDLSDDQLTAALDAGALPERIPEAVAEAVAAAEPEPPAERDAEAERDTAPEPSLDDLRAELDRYKERAQHWERVAGKHAGRLGYLEKVQTMRRDAPAADPDSPAADWSDDPLSEFDRAAETDPELARRVDDLDREMRQRRRDEGIAGVGASLRPLFQGLAPADIEAAAASDPALSAALSEVLDDDDPDEAPQRFRTVAAAIATKAHEIKAARQVSTLMHRKEAGTVSRMASIRAAGLSGSGGAHKVERAKSVNDMTTDEIENALNSLDGGRW